LKTIWDKGLIYEGRKVLMYCPRCETPVSKAETAMDNSYKDIEEETVVIKFKIKDSNDVILAWTTTPWSLPGNVALAVGEKISYVYVKVGGEDGHVILAKDKLQEVLKNHEYEVVKEVKGSELVGLEYEPLFEIDEVKNSGKKVWYVVAADFVTTEDGTGVVHTAVIYGEDDYALGVEIDLPMVPLLDGAGIFNNEAPDLIKGEYFKKAEVKIKKDLDDRGLIFKKEKLTHSSPHCWRCETQLFYNAISAWFINVQKVKSRMVDLNEKINWYPNHLKHGRFLNILKSAPDWNISRNRYWATPLPFWKCEKENCDEVVCVGSVDELREKAVNFDEVYKSEKVEEIDLHKHKMDLIKLKCKCDAEMKRIPEVVDCWVESSSMPFAEFHYPFENKEVFEGRFPGKYIGEYIAQTRAWFYYMHVMSVLLFDNISFENCIATGTILNDKGEKLSKSKKNYTDPWEIIDQYGVDALRFYLMTSVLMQAENLDFKDDAVKEIYNKVVNLLSNVLSFYLMFADDVGVGADAGAVGATKIDQPNFDHVLDKWILARLNELKKQTTEHLDNYNTVKAGRPIKDFIDELSTWYVRRSRDRFKAGNDDAKAAVTTLRHVLLELSKLMAPFTPFISEKIYQEVGGEMESVHLESWPEVSEEFLNEKILQEMALVRKIVELGLSARSEAKLRVRQPLSEVHYTGEKLSEELGLIVAQELNVKKVVSSEDLGEGLVIKENGELKVGLNVEITDDLKQEGVARELIRAINSLRKEQGFTIKDHGVLSIFTDNDFLKKSIENHKEVIEQGARVDVKFVESLPDDAKQVDVQDGVVSFTIKK